MSFAEETIVAFLLVSARILATLTVAPPFNGGMVPVRIRLGLSVALGLLLVSGNPPSPGPMNTGELVVALTAQVTVGLVFGFFVQLLFSAFQLAGSIIDLSAGLSAGALYDPMTQSQVAPTGRLYQMFSLALLVALDGHLLIVQGVIRSYEAAPVGTLSMERLGPAMASGAGQLLIAAVEVSFPVLAALLLTELALAIASRAAPKMNIMAIGFGVKSLVLLFALSFGLPLMANAVQNILETALRTGSTLIGS